jgi:hypothetical protein
MLRVNIGEAAECRTEYELKLLSDLFLNHFKSTKLLNTISLNYSEIILYFGRQLYS